jgi:hypothetical protein
MLKRGDAMVRLLVSDEEIGTLVEVSDELQHVRDVLRHQQDRMIDETFWSTRGAGQAIRTIVEEGTHLAMAICRLEELLACGHQIEGAAKAAARLRESEK